MKMSAPWLASTAFAASLILSASASAAPVYSFEDDLDGFFGLGAAVSAEATIGVTDGATSLKYTVGAGGFVGVRTETVIPAGLNNPPGVTSILFDMNIQEIPDTLTFADIGITLFGHELDGGVFGIQMQFADSVSITSLGVGQHLDLVIDLDMDFFSGESFNELFGDAVDDLDVVSAFQFYISKTASVGLTVYIDNVRLAGAREVDVPEPATGLILGAAAMLGMAARRRKSVAA